MPNSTVSEFGEMENIHLENQNNMDASAMGGMDPNLALSEGEEDFDENEYLKGFSGAGLTGLLANLVQQEQIVNAKQLEDLLLKETHSQSTVGSGTGQGALSKTASALSKASSLAKSMKRKLKKPLFSSAKQGAAGADDDLVSREVSEMQSNGSRSADLMSAISSKKKIGDAEKQESKSSFTLGSNKSSSSNTPSQQAGTGNTPPQTAHSIVPGGEASSSSASAAEKQKAMLADFLFESWGSGQEFEIVRKNEKGELMRFRILPSGQTETTPVNPSEVASVQASQAAAVPGSQVPALPAMPQQLMGKGGLDPNLLSGNLPGASAAALATAKGLPSAGSAGQAGMPGGPPALLGGKGALGLKGKNGQMLRMAGVPENENMFAEYLNEYYAGNLPNSIAGNEDVEYDDGDRSAKSSMANKSTLGPKSTRSSLGADLTSQSGSSFNTSMASFRSTETLSPVQMKYREEELERLRQELDGRNSPLKVDGNRINWIRAEDEALVARGAPISAETSTPRQNQKTSRFDDVNSAATFSTVTPSFGGKSPVSSQMPGTPALASLQPSPTTTPNNSIRAPHSMVPSSPSMLCNPIPHAKDPQTPVCINWIRKNGKCKWGDACRFQHVGDPQAHNIRCMHFLKGRCELGNACRFRHDLDGLDCYPVGVPGSTSLLSAPTSSGTIGSRHSVTSLSSLASMTEEEQLRQLLTMGAPPAAPQAAPQPNAAQQLLLAHLQQQQQQAALLNMLGASGLDPQSIQALLAQQQQQNLPNLMVSPPAPATAKPAESAASRAAEKARRAASKLVDPNTAALQEQLLRQAQAQAASANNANPLAGAAGGAQEDPRTVAAANALKAAQQAMQTGNRLPPGLEDVMGQGATREQILQQLAANPTQLAESVPPEVLELIYGKGY
jgi:hypothetical protein